MRPLHVEFDSKLRTQQAMKSTDWGYISETLGYGSGNTIFIHRIYLEDVEGFDDAVGAFLAKLDRLFNEAYENEEI